MIVWKGVLEVHQPLRDPNQLHHLELPAGYANRPLASPFELIEPQKLLGVWHNRHHVFPARDHSYTNNIAVKSG
jgi:hypothetical protein